MKQYKKHHDFLCIILLVLAGILLVLPNPADAQGRKDALFQETESIMKQAEDMKAPLFSPKNFANGIKYLTEAEDNFKKGKSREDINEKLGKAGQAFNASIETTKMAKINFQDLISARNDAMAAEAPVYRKEDWEKAEKALNDATKTLEGGNLKGSKNKAKKAEELYRAVELESIKANYLDETRALLEKGQKTEVRKNSEKTFNMAKNLADRAEVLLNESRYDTDESRQLAREAKYEVQHAFHISKEIEKTKENDVTLEEIFLQSEKPVQAIADELDLNARFQDGFDPPTQAIIKTIKQYKRTIAELTQDVNDKNEQIRALERQMASMESQLGDLKTKEASLSKIMEQQRIWREKYAKVEKIFSPSEAQVHRTGDDVTIRLYGLNFASGKSVIESQYFSLLVKVQQAIDLYPESMITIEGHTDSFGGDEFNRDLSTQRAEAVKEYFRTTGGIPPERLIATGYGETKPIASNETKEGRRKNRRIDVVIHPKKM